MQSIIEKALGSVRRFHDLSRFSRWMSTQSASTYITRVRRKSPPIIVDGAIISALDPNFPPNSAQTAMANRTLDALRHHPESIRNVHERYIQAGANVIRTANQFAVPYLLGNNLNELEHLTRLAGRLAWEGREATCTPIHMPPVSVLYERVHQRLSNNRFRSSLEEPSMWESPMATSTGHRRSRPGWELHPPQVPPQPEPRTTYLSSSPTTPMTSPDHLKGKVEYYYNGHRVLIAGRLPPVIDSTIQSTHTSRNLTALQHGDDIAERLWISYKDQRRALETMVRALDPYVDLFICEASSSIPQAEMAARAAMITDKPVWVGFVLKERVPGIPRLASGESITQAVDNLLTHLPRFVDGYLLNNSEPNAVSATLPLLRSVTRRPIGIFARLTTGPSSSNSYFSTSSSTAESPGVISPEDYCSLVSRWVDIDSADMIGGCWGVGVDHIRALSERFNPNACPVSLPDAEVIPSCTSSPQLSKSIVSTIPTRHPLEPREGRISQNVWDEAKLRANGLKPTRFKNFFRMVADDDVLLSRHFANLQRRTPAPKIDQ